MGELGIFADEAVLNWYYSKIKDFFFSEFLQKGKNVLYLFFFLCHGCKGMRGQSPQ